MPMMRSKSLYFWNKSKVHSEGCIINKPGGYINRLMHIHCKCNITGETEDQTHIMGMKGQLQMRSCLRIFLWVKRKKR
jgi:hypothetical protein